LAAAWQVGAFFRWVDWLRQQAKAAGKEPVFINLDETSVSRSWPRVGGNVVKPKSWIAPHKPPRVKATRKDYRGAITGVMLCSHRQDVQKVLPQIYIGNGHVFPAGELAAAVSALPSGPVHFWRQTTSWNSVASMLRILQLLCDALAPFPTLQPILVFDAASIHLHQDVLVQAVRLKLWLLCVPARLTWLLQPLDTHVLVNYKRWLRLRYRQLLLRNEATFASWLLLLHQAAVAFLTSRSWSRAFYADGLLGRRADLSKAIVAHAGSDWLQGDKLVPELSRDDLCTILPQGSSCNQHYRLWLHGPRLKRFIMIIVPPRKKARTTATA
jgi:hypothetical protein